MRIRRWARRACFGTAGVFAILGLVGPGSATAEPNPPSTHPPQYGASAVAVAIEADVNTDPPQQVEEILHARVPVALGEFRSGGTSRSMASPVDPGLFVSKGAGLLCTAGFPCAEFPGFPPAYPFTAEAEYPLKRDADPQAQGRTFGGGPMSMTLGETRAHAGEEASTAVSRANELSLGATGGPETAVVHVAASHATTEISFPDPAAPNVLVTKAESKLSKVTALLGRLEIDSIVATSESRSDGGQLVANKASVTVKGATLDGHPIEITDEGLVIDGAPRDEGGIGQLDGALKEIAAGVQGEAQLVGLVNEKSGQRAQAGATGVMLSYRIQPDPQRDAVVGSILLGKAGTTAFVSLRDPLGTVDTGGETLDPGPSVAPAPGDASLDPVSAGTGDDTSGEVTATDTGGAGAPADGDSGLATEDEGAKGAPSEAAERVGLLAELASSRMTAFYLAWTLSLLGLALGSRLPSIRLGNA